MVGVLAAWAVSEFRVSPNREIASALQAQLTQVAVVANVQNAKETLFNQLFRPYGDPIPLDDVRRGPWAVEEFRYMWMLGQLDAFYGHTIAIGNLDALSRMYSLPVNGARDSLQMVRDNVYSYLTGQSFPASVLQIYQRLPKPLANLPIDTLRMAVFSLDAAWDHHYVATLFRQQELAISRSRLGGNVSAVLFALGSVLLVAGKFLEMKNGRSSTEIASAPLPG